MPGLGEAAVRRMAIPTLELYTDGLSRALRTLSTGIIVAVAALRRRDIAN